MKLKIENLNFSFDNEKILNDINFTIAENEFISILGYSGCGKSTLLNIIAGLIEKSSGKIYVDGNKVDGISEHFSYMPQQDLLLPWKNIYQNVSLWNKIHKKNKRGKSIAKEKSDIERLIKEFGLDGYSNKFPKHLSGGMKQRVAFLRTALCNADIWLLDEPFAALDVITRSQMQEWLLDIRKKINKTMLLVTHDVDEAIYLSDRILILGNRPSSIVEQINLGESNRNRTWLFKQTELKEHIYENLSKN